MFAPFRVVCVCVCISGVKFLVLVYCSRSSYVAMFPYTPRKEDELELRKGEMFLVLERCQDGWFKGTSMHTGKIGVFPGNYMSPVSRSVINSQSLICYCRCIVYLHAWFHVHLSVMHSHELITSPVCDCIKSIFIFLQINSCGRRANKLPYWFKNVVRNS